MANTKSSSKTCSKKYTKKSLKKILEDNNITTTMNSVAALLVIALDNGVISREEILQNSESDESLQIDSTEGPKRSRGRPRKYPPKIVDKTKEKDPKYDRIRTQSKVAIPVTLTNIETGEVRTFKSQCMAGKVVGKSEKFFARHNGEVFNGDLIQLG